MKTITKLYAKASLLDRLIDFEPKLSQESPPFRTLSAQAMRAVIRRDLEWLLNTRCSVSQDELALRQRSVIDYGIIDLSTISAKNIDDYRRLAQMMEETIRLYEPRLQDLRVTVVSLSNVHRKLGAEVIIEGLLVVDAMREPVSFPMTIRGNEVKFSHDHET